MRRRAWLTVVGALLVPRPARALGVHITGTLSATDQEAQEGYFALGAELMIVTRPNSPIHDDLRSMVGSSVQCSVFTVK